MVDPTKGVGPYQNLISGSRVSDSDNSKKTSTVKDTSAPRDEVTFSPKALSVSQAQETSTKLRDSLQSDSSLTLSSGSNFDESL